jgi:alanyl-tRNA synthetase
MFFAPQGGGQPADLGSIKFADWEFAVEMVTVDRADGVVHHVGALEGNPAARVPIGSEVSLAIDEAHRPPRSAREVPHRQIVHIRHAEAQERKRGAQAKVRIELHD